MLTRHNFAGEMRIFLVKICINPYPSFLCIDVSRKLSYRDAVCKKIATLSNKNLTASSKEPKSELYVTWRDSRIRPTPLIN